MAMNRSRGEGFWSNLPFADFLRYWDFKPSTSWFQHFITINNNAGDVGPEATVLAEVGRADGTWTSSFGQVEHGHPLSSGLIDLRFGSGGHHFLNQLGPMSVDD